MYVPKNTAIFDPDLYNVIDFDPELDLVKRRIEESLRAEEERREAIIKKRKLKLLKYYMKQKMIGVVSIVLGLLAPRFIECGGFLTLSMMSFGIYLIITKEKIMIF